MTTASIAIYVRHSADCKYKADESFRRCKCRKHLRWPINGKQQRQCANTRSWAEAEEVKRRLAEELSGTSRPILDLPSRTSTTLLEHATSVFISDEQLQGLSDDVVKKYIRLLSRLKTYCEECNALTPSS